MIISQLGKEFDLTVLSINPEKTKKISSNSKIVKASLSNFFKEIKRNDALVLGGGGIIQDQSSIINMLYYFLQTYVASKVFNKNVYLLFVGVGPIHTGASRKMLKRMGKWIDYSVVRDNESASILESAGFKAKNISIANDIVFNIQSNEKNQKNEESDYFVFCPRDWFFRKNLLPAKISLKISRKISSSDLYTFRQNLLALLEEVLSDDSARVIGVPFFLTQDLDLLNWLNENLSDNQKRRFEIIEKDMSPSEFLVIARNARAVIGVRLHSLILGAVARRPLIALTYSTKVVNLTRYLGLSKSTIELNKPNFFDKDAEKIIREIKSVSLNYENLLPLIQEKNEETLRALVKRIETSS